MKLTVTSTDEVDRSRDGMGRVFEGTTGGGVPVRVLVCGITAGARDPATIARFEREYATLPEIEVQLPDDDDTLVLRSAHIDLYEVIARWLLAYGEEFEPMPPGVTIEQLAIELRVRKDPKAERMMAAAGAVAEFIVRTVLEAPMVTSATEVGHA